MDIRGEFWDFQPANRFIATQDLPTIFPLAEILSSAYLCVMPTEVPDRDEWFLQADGLPQPDWLAINEWIINVVGEKNRREISEQITRYWLVRIAGALGAPFTVAESEHFMILSTRERRPHLHLVEHLDRAHEHVLNTLGKAAGIRNPRKLVILRVETMDQMFALSESFTSQKTAAHEFFGRGSRPIIRCTDRNFSSEVRELARAIVYHLLGYLTLPHWLHYGVGELLTTEVCGGRFALLSEDMFNAHHRTWNRTSIQRFWSGRAFYHPKLGQISYNLSTVLLDILRRELKPDYSKYQRFVQTASPQDAGEAAAQRFFGVGLGEIATVFFGEGDWSPHPAMWPEDDEPL
jgi:hypothetical protein